MTFVIDPSSIAQTVANNIRTIVETFHTGKGAQTDAAKRCKMHQRTLGRAMNGEQSASLDTLQAVAEGYGLQPWHLLIPNLDPKNPPAIHQMTEQETQLYARLRGAAEELASFKK